jgi:hypothetical protein
VKVSYDRVVYNQQKEGETLEDKGKEKRIKAEIKRLNIILKDVDANTSKGVKSLIENAAFMSVSLDELQKIINEKGYTEVYTNGATQSGIKKCSEVEIYNVMIKNHMAVMKQLTDLIPKGQAESDELIAFLSSGRK